jgi:toxin ParE1/3/4
MPNSYQLTTRAVDDLSDIWRYTVDTWSETQADRNYQMLLGHCQDIADGLVFGKPYSDVIDDLFGSAIGQHNIFYHRVQEDLIEIARILHGRVDLRRRLGK